MSSDPIPKNGESSRSPSRNKVDQPEGRQSMEGDEDWESLEDAATLRRKSSPAQPGSPRRSTPTSPTSGDRRRHSARTKNGSGTGNLSPGAESSGRRRPMTAEGTSRSRQSPLAKRLGEEVPHEYTAAQNYPGVVDFDMDGMQLDVSMDDILDRSAAGPGRQGSTAGQPAAPNIAPWLMDDSTPPQSGQVTPLTQPGGLSTAPSSTMPKLNRLQSEQSLRTVGSSRNGSQPSITGMPTSQEPDATFSRHGSGDSLQTLAATQQKPVAKQETPMLPGGGRHSIAGGRIGRFGSTVSNVSAGSGEKKKGFLGGLLKRKGTAMSLGPIPDFSPVDHRGSTTGSSGSRISSSTSFASLSQHTSTPEMDAGGPFDRHYPSMSDGMISPLQELAEPEFRLDMNLDDMEGIVDPNMANAPPAPAPSRHPTMANTAIQQQQTGQDTGMALQDALQHHAGHRSEGSSGSATSSQPSGREGLRESIIAANNPFTKQNPFASGSSNGSLDFKPPSPHAYSPKHSLPTTAQPRRPSQLRNVKMGSIDSESSTGSRLDGGPLQPSWATMSPSQPTVFNDPFGPARASLSGSQLEQGSGHDSHSRTTTGTSQATLPSEAQSQAPAIAGPGAAWAAPESWGVEGDEEDSGNDTSSDSAADNGEWPPEDEPASPEVMPERRPSLILPISEGKKAPPFGFKSNLSGRGARGGAARPGTANKAGRGKTRDGRPSTAARTGTSNRPGTSGSAHMAVVPHLIRIYRADGSYTIHSFNLLATTHDIINALSGANDAPAGKRITTTMKLYLRERGQDRMLLPSEKPLNIQSRRLQQAGFTEAEHLEELGKEDLGTLCKFIYQTPALPIIDPEEESSYDSFEFIDIAGRDLQTIPIFLHLHAHNIIILNVSRNPMTDLPLDFIQACSSLKELRMTNMALKRVPASIRASQTLSRLDVSSNRIADLESVSLHEIQTLLSLKVQNNKLTSIPSYFSQMKALKYLNISNNKFESFPSVVCEMSNLVDLDISFNNIAELPSEMSNLKSLERLLVYGNDLTTFPESFSTLANLRVLDVRRNKLTNLNSVYALPNLATLQADFNDLVTLDAQIGAKVRQFSVPHNSITRFTLAPLPNMQAVTYSLTHLNLSHGKISTLADEALSGLINLVDLNLDFNQFTRLPSTLDRLVNLESFSCTDNQLDSFPAGFGRMSKLHTLNAHNNNIGEIPGDLWFCGSLRSANFSSNLLNELPIAPETAEYSSSKGVLPPAAYSIERVYFGDNRLTSDVFHLLTLVPGIKIVNLSFNDIYEIPPLTLSRCESLEALYLSGNKLTSLPSEDLEKLQNLKVLHLNGNRLVTLPSELGAIKSLQHLDVGSNMLKYNIANWPYDWNWNWNTGLKYLNLSGNKRLEIKPTSAQDMSHASSLRKELSDFTALTELCVLGLMDVTLRIPSLPDESDAKRVRTSFSDINNMAYGISDMMGALEQMAMFDMVVPHFRGKDNECLFGMFGRPRPTQPSGKVAKFLQETFAGTLSQQLDELEPFEQITDAMRRSFLQANRKSFDYLAMVAHERKRSVASFNSVDEMFKAWSPGPTSLFKSGASGAVVYLVDKTLYCANAGHALIVLSRKGEAELLSKRHHCTDREETTRIRKAEAWVSTKGYMNDDKDMDISRAFGYWHHAPGVNASPEVRVRELTEYDEFVIIGNNALWACCSYQTAVDIARAERDDPMMAAQKLRDFAISYGAQGSVMVMVVNISDLFGRGTRRTRGAGSGPAVVPDPSAADAELYASTMRAVRRRYEEVGDRTLNRLQSEIEPPQGQVAIVFTDIVNSTHLWETNPGMPTAIKMHHNLMRRQLRLDGGYEVKTEGDSFMVSFQTVTAGLLWAFNCQIGLLQQEWPRELLQCPDGDVVLDSDGNIVQRGLRVRMGIHWGSPSCERDPITRRMDYYGPMVNRAARINASADGGQLMASQDVIYEIELLRDYLDSLDEEGLDGLPNELKREVQEIRRIGIEMRDMGERKLKGLEVPERLHLLYPKTLAGRLESSNDIRANVEVHDPRALQAELRHIDIEQVRELSAVTLRLEALSAAHHRVHPPPVASSPAVSPTVEASPKALTVRPPPPRPLSPSLPPAYLGPAIREEMTDEELTVIIESLTTRIENTMSTLYLKHLDGFSAVLAALEQATRMDPRVIVQALSLMNGQLEQ